MIDLAIKPGINLWRKCQVEKAFLVFQGDKYHTLGRTWRLFHEHHTKYKNIRISCQRNQITGKAKLVQVNLKWPVLSLDDCNRMIDETGFEGFEVFLDLLQYLLGRPAKRCFLVIE